MSTHQANLLRVMGDSRIEAERQSNPTTYSDALLSQSMQDLLIRGFVDIEHDPANSHRRRRIERATSAVANTSSALAPNAAAEEAIDFLDAELALTTFRDANFTPAPQSIGLFTMATTASPQKRANLIRLLYFLGRKQSAIFDAFMALELIGLVSLDSLALPIAIDRLNSAIIGVSEFLKCFDVGRQLENHKQYADAVGVRGTTQVPLDWLSIVLVRSCPDIPLALEFLRVSKYLGEFSLELLAELGDPPPPPPKHDARAAEGDVRKPAHFNLLLPLHVPQLDFRGGEVASSSSWNQWTTAQRNAVYSSFETRFCHLEETFKLVFNLTDEDLCVPADDPVPPIEIYQSLF
jgi:hypothetical protein